MNTNMTDFKWFSRNFDSLCFGRTENGLNIGRVKESESVSTAIQIQNITACSRFQGMAIIVVYIPNVINPSYLSSIIVNLTLYNDTLLSMLCHCVLHT